MGPASPGGSASTPEKTQEQRVRELNFSGHIGLSGVHRIATVHCPVHYQPNSYLSELAVGADRGRIGGAPDCPVRPCAE
jgi:hypothetical protein